MHVYHLPLSKVNINVELTRNLHVNIIKIKPSVHHLLVKQFVIKYKILTLTFTLVTLTLDQLQRLMNFNHVCKSNEDLRSVHVL